MAITEIKPLTRIEGDAKLELDTYLDSANKLRVKNGIATKDGTLATPTNNGARYPKFCVTEFRGFEKFIVGETPDTVTRLVPRICGVCPVPHGAASAASIEAACGVTIADNAKAIRRLMAGVHTVHSHLLHIFLLAGRDFLPHTLLDQELANVVTAHNKAQACVAVFGARPVHQAGILPGGMTKTPSSTELSTIKTRMGEINSYLGKLLPQIKAQLLKIPKDVGNRPANYLSSGIPFYSGVSGSFSYYGAAGGVVLRNSSKPMDFGAATIVPFQPANLKEEIIVPYGNTLTLPDQYSYAKRPYYAYNGTNYVVEVGPLARIAVAYKAGDAVVKKNAEALASSLSLSVGEMLSPGMRNRHIARLLETQILIDRIINSWTGAVTTARAYSKPTLKAGTGTGVYEAPRGTLVHKITIGSDLKTAALDIVVPTTINSPAIEEAVADELVEMTPATAALLKHEEDPADINLKLLLGDAALTARSFDPCCSCSSHVIGPKYNGIKVRI